jgi:hypothetical protein
MNIITHSNAYSLFPQATFETRRTVLTHDTSTSSPEAMTAARQKYVDRGWSFVDTASSLEALAPRSEFSSFGIRHIGDHACWTIRLSSFEGLSTYDDLWLNSWQIIWGTNGSMNIDFLVFHGPRFRFGKCAVRKLSKAMRHPDNYSLTG